MSSACTSCWTLTPRSRSPRATRPVFVWRTLPVTRDITADSPAPHTLRCLQTHLCMRYLVHHGSPLTQALCLDAGFESRLLWHLQCRHRLSVDRHHWRVPWKIHPQGLEALFCSPSRKNVVIKTGLCWFSSLLRPVLRFPSAGPVSTISTEMLCEVVCINETGDLNAFPQWVCECVCQQQMGSSGWFLCPRVVLSGDGQSKAAGPRVQLWQQRCPVWRPLHRLVCSCFWMHHHIVRNESLSFQWTWLINQINPAVAGIQTVAELLLVFSCCRVSSCQH